MKKLRKRHVSVGSFRGLLKSRTRSMRQQIPGTVMAAVASFISDYTSRIKIESLFMYAGAPGHPPLASSKESMALEWLRIINGDESLNPLDVLGRIIETPMEEEIDSSHPWDSTKPTKLIAREKLERALTQSDLKYLKGGKVIPFQTVAAPSRTLEQLLKGKDIKSVDLEFERALKNVAVNPREAASAASNILESLCKVYIEESSTLALPTKLDLKSVWSLVRKDLGFDSGSIVDQDLQKILTGLFSIVDGIASLRSHASSAHGAGKKGYVLEARHARLAVHAAHTTALFILETWQKKKI